MLDYLCQRRATVEALVDRDERIQCFNQQRKPSCKTCSAYSRNSLDLAGLSRNFVFLLALGARNYYCTYASRRIGQATTVGRPGFLNGDKMIFHRGDATRVTQSRRKLCKFCWEILPCPLRARKCMQLGLSPHSRIIQFRRYTQFGKRSKTFSDEESLAKDEKRNL